MASETGRSREGILIVEDQATMRVTLRKFLEPALPGHAFFEVADGTSALEMCRAIHPRVVLMDISLPDLNGIEVAKRLMTQTPECRIVFVSYLNDPGYIGAALEAGGCAYVVKDRLFSDLIPAIERALADSGPPNEA